MPDGAKLPAQPNFSDTLPAFVFDASACLRMGSAVRGVESPASSRISPMGGRGVGTRNFIVILGTTSRTASFARQLAAHLQPLARVHPSLDGIVAVAHTEGGGNSEPHNADEVLRALAGFVVHPNVGAVLAVDYGVEPVANARLRSFMEEHGYPLADVPHRFLTLSGPLTAGLAEGERVVRDWLPHVSAERRTNEPISRLQVGPLPAEGTRMRFPASLATRWPAQSRMRLSDMGARRC